MAERAAIRALLFDMDGVLVDSIPNHARAWQEAFQQRGVAIDDRLSRLREGEKALATCHWICERYGLAWSEEDCVELVRRKRELFRSYPGSGLFPGVSNLLEGLKHHGYRLALVTGSTVVNARAIVPETVWQLFEVHIAAEDVTRGKPDPQPFRLAASRLGVDVRACLAVENAPFGIESALAAGCRVVALTTTLDAHELTGAERILARHEELIDMLKGETGHD